MTRSERRTNPLILRQGMSIGNNAAENDDDFLFQCFVHHGAVDVCQDFNSAGMILSGRTGSGKTAMLRYIERNSSNQVVVDPFEMAMNYVSNSDALNFVQAIGADLDLLFQTLWKHVLCIEFIRLRFSVKDEEKSKNVFARLWESVSRDSRKQRALEYLREWEGKFFLTMDENIREITTRVESDLTAAMGADIKKFRAGGQYEKRLSTEEKSELVSRARRIIDADQLIKLNSIIDTLGSPQLNDNKFLSYILIDRLDEKWVDSSIKYKLIRALIEALRSFRKIQTLKVIVALRSDVIERALQEATDVSFQREKFEDYIVHIPWSKAQLKELVNKRLNELLKKQYSSTQIWFEDVFRHPVSGKDPFDYMLERTLMRPRDVIHFVNECIAASDGEYEVNASRLKRAELQFSRVRRHALEQEWLSVYPALPSLLNFLSSIKRTSFGFRVMRDILDEFALSIIDLKGVEHDPLFQSATHFADKTDDGLNLMSRIAEIGYRVGAIGVKLAAQERHWFAYTDQPLLPVGALSLDARIRIHPMLYGAFGLAEDRKLHRS